MWSAKHVLLKVLSAQRYPVNMKIGSFDGLFSYRSHDYKLVSNLIREPFTDEGLSSDRIKSKLGSSILLRSYGYTTYNYVLSILLSAFQYSIKVLQLSVYMIAYF